MAGAELKLVGEVTRTGVADASGLHPFLDLPSGEYVLTATRAELAGSARVLIVERVRQLFELE